MKYDLRSFFVMFLFGCFLNVGGQVKELPGLKKEDIIADYRLAMDILKKQHPNPYKFIDSIALERKVDSLMKEAAKQEDVFALANYSPVYLIRDVHLNLRWSADNGKEAIKATNFFPVPVMIERGRVFVNSKETELPFAAEIMTINLQPVASVLDGISSQIYADGNIATATDRFYGEFQAALSLKNHNRKSYEIGYREPFKNEIKRVTLSAENPSEGIRRARHAFYPVNVLQRSYWIYSDFDDVSKLAVLTVNSFNLAESYAYKEFSTFFKEVNKRGYKNVIIDIRSNGGGNPNISALLYSFLSLMPFHNIFNYRTRTIDIAYPEYAIADGRKMSDDDIQSQKNFLYQRYDKDDKAGFYIGNTRLREGQLENFPPDKDAFKGSVYVLTGGGTVSAATYFASLVQKNNRGLIVGKETGSGENATTAAWFLTYQLPRTKSILTVPMSELYFFNATIDKGRGIMPDKEVPMDQFMTYMKNGKDPELCSVKDMILLK
ncbi:S41 family peptidase [Niabella pedocola]|uniref:S41 family peptidase n=1 Tax=Niabella pedocola TaxID=1752077 RepID=A0ABS8PX86_9BACT|nr:S41 family peptidase [Niabella pedocola]MCD2425677.1 S41 family peptidase [Niabella pedocola]